MKRLAMLAAAFCMVCSITSAAVAQSAHKTSKTHKVARAHKKKKYPAKPKNEVTKLEKARATDNTTRQVTPDPHKSPGKHADNLSKNVNHELNRESKDINHLFQGKKKK